MTPIFHRDCGGLIFHYDGPLEAGVMIWRERVMLLDGSMPLEGTKIDFKCAKCGNVVRGFHELTAKEGA